MYTLLIFFFTLSILFSFLCSLWEAVLLSVTPSYALIKIQRGEALGKRLKEFKDNIDRPLAAILTLNTIAHTVGAIGVGEQATKIWSETNPLITRLVVPALMTLAVLVLSEIIPKTIGANFWRELAPFTVASLSFAMMVLAPLVWGSQLITKTLKRDKGKSVLSRSDFLAMAEIGASEGLFHQNESQIIRNLLRFNTVRARDVMTPRTVVKAASENDSIENFYNSNPALAFSRIPTYRNDSMDDITGFVLKDDIHAKMLQGEGHESMSTLRREIMITTENSSVPDLFNRFLEEREHIALVLDGYGGMAGIVTMEDVIETLLGLEIVDELDHEEDMQHLARRNWEKRAKSLGLIPDDFVEAAADAPKPPTEP
jgi:CBS domain containing-hemolysin-like protein